MKPKWLSGIGSTVGTFLGVGCPACVPAIGAVVSAIGLGFLVNMSVLGPLTLITLIIGISGLYANTKKHGLKKFFYIGSITSLIVFSSRYILEFLPTLYLGAAMLMINAFLDYKETKKNPCCPPKKNYKKS